MKRNYIADVYELQTGMSLNSALDEVYRNLPKETTPEEWKERIEVALDPLDLNDKQVKSHIAANLQKSEQKKHVSAPPGVGTKLQLDALDDEWFEKNGIAIEDIEEDERTGEERVIQKYVSWAHANGKPEYSLQYVKQRQQKVKDASDASMRAMEMHEMNCEPGGIMMAVRKRRD